MRACLSVAIIEMVMPSNSTEAENGTSVSSVEEVHQIETVSYNLLRIEINSNLLLF